MAMWRRAMVYLGLVDDDEEYPDEGYYEDDGEYEEPEPVAAARPRRPPAADKGSVSVIRPVAPPVADTGPVAVATVRPATSSVRTVPAPAARVHVMEPTGFNDAQEVGDRLKANQPVILNLQRVDRDLQRRLIDFSSGLAYALGGHMSKAADQVFLITPSNVEVSDEEKERLQARGLYRPR